MTLEDIFGKSRQLPVLILKDCHMDKYPYSNIVWTGWLAFQKQDINSFYWNKAYEQLATPDFWLGEVSIGTNHQSFTN